MANNYTNYQSMVTTITTAINRLGASNGVLADLKMEEQRSDLMKAGEKLQNHLFSVGIMGEFKRGKSTVINALLGADIVPSDIVPCSATLNYIRYDTNPNAEVRFKDGSSKNVGVDELSDYVSKITEESERMAATVEDAVVYYPCEFCKNGVQIVDTPGLNDDERMTAISENVIPTLDAIIMVLVPDAPFSQSEAEFVRNKLMASDLGKIIFLVNKIDTIDEDDVDRVLAGIKNKITKSVLEKMKTVYGEESDEYEKAKNIVGDIKLVPVSARKALKGKLKKNSEMLAQSGFEVFENVLSKMLTEERGVLELMPPVNKISTVAKAADDIIRTRRDALKLSADEFEKIQEESAEKLIAARKQKKEEIASLKAKGNNLYAELLPEVNLAYEEIESTMKAYVANYPVNEDSVKNEESINRFSEEFARNLDAKITDCLSVHTERLSHRIREQLGRDVQVVHDFSFELEQNLGSIHDSIRLPSGSQSNGGSMVSTVLIDAGVMFGTATLSAGTSMIPGLGGLIAGFREHGIKGAVVGGLSGAVLSTLGISLAATAFGIVGLPVAIIGGIAGSFGGRGITRLIFGKKEQPKAAPDFSVLTEKLNEAVNSMMYEMRKESALEKWLKETCDEAYSMVAANIDDELERALSGMEETLTQIKIDIKMNEENKSNCEKELNDNEATIVSILNELAPIKDKLTASLGN